MAKLADHPMSMKEVRNGRAARKDPTKLDGTKKDEKMGMEGTRIMEAATNWQRRAPEG